MPWTGPIDRPDPTRPDPTHLPRGRNVGDAHAEGLVSRLRCWREGIDGLQEGGAVVPRRQRPAGFSLRHVLSGEAGRWYVADLVTAAVR